jgi:DNA polymerase III epsilon subunit-like protein
VEDVTELSGLSATRFSVIDVETSGLSASRHRVLQIGLVTCRADGAVESTWSTMVRPFWWRIARVGPTWLHGIRRRDLRGAPRSVAAFGDLAQRIDGTVLVAHNMSFDWGFLQRGAQAAHVALPQLPRLCTLQLARSLDPERLYSHKLTDLCERYGVGHTQPHHALSDAAATAGLLPKLLADAGVDSVEALLQRCER